MTSSFGKLHGTTRAGSMNTETKRREDGTAAIHCVAHPSEKNAVKQSSSSYIARFCLLWERAQTLLGAVSNYRICNIAPQNTQTLLGTAAAASELTCLCCVSLHRKPKCRKHSAYRKLPAHCTAVYVGVHAAYAAAAGSGKLSRPWLRLKVRFTEPAFAPEAVEHSL